MNNEFEQFTSQTPSPKLAPNQFVSPYGEQSSFRRHQRIVPFARGWGCALQQICEEREVGEAEISRCWLCSSGEL